jgi:hypothetical protein
MEKIKIINLYYSSVYIDCAGSTNTGITGALIDADQAQSVVLDRRRWHGRQDVV